MKKDEITVWKTPRTNIFRRGDAEVAAPKDWVEVPSGDPLLTRRLKASGEYWVIVRKRKNRLESVGIMTDGARIDAVKTAIESERSDPAYRKRLENQRKAREAKQDAYVIEFRQAVVDFLNFHKRYAEIALDMADAVTDHAIPVGSGTVARTTRIPLERRAEAAVIAWMRHQTTSYDNMRIARVKGERREVRRELAERSRTLLAEYRSGGEIDFKKCPLAGALGLTTVAKDKTK